MYLIYGAGNIGNGFLLQCKEKGIEEIMLADSNPDLWGKRLNEYKIVNPNRIDYQNIQLAIISTDYTHFNEIKKYLLTRIDEKKIVHCREVLLLSANDRLNLGTIKLSKEFIYPGIYKKNQIYDYFEKESFNDLDKFFYQEKHSLIHKLVHYTEGYERFFSKYRGRKVTLLEIGVCKGGSLQMWKNYLGEKARIIGLDIDPECKKLEEENIEIYIGDQESRKFLRSLKKKIGQVDIIVDDGGHTMEQQIVSFEELFDSLSEDGVYLCEDCQTSYWSSYNGGYKEENTFIEYSKNLIDGLNAQYIGKDAQKEFKNNANIKSLTFYDGMVFIEKRKSVNKSIDLQVGL